MKILLINSVCGVGSTGRICADIAKQYIADGHEAKIAYGRIEYVPEDLKQNSIKIGSDLDVKLHAIKTRITDKHGLGSVRATKKFLKWAEDYNPDLLWLHNIHGYFINYELLFNWIKSRPDMEVRWTLHDCWAFTGHCTYFTISNCYKWRTGCSECPQKSEYPKSGFADNSNENFIRKRSAFTGVKKMRLITPSNWLKDLVKQSFLSKYPIEVVHNKIDTEIFKPTPSDFKKKHNLENKIIVLGVANGWEARKGFNDFIKLSKLLDDNHVIVLVGLNKKQIKHLPDYILGIERTSSERELAEIYTAADVFLNMTYEDNYPTVNLEAQACGTKVIAYDTGGCRETIISGNSKIVKTGDMSAVYNLVKNLIW